MKTMKTEDALYLSLWFNEHAALKILSLNRIAVYLYLYRRVSTMLWGNIWWILHIAFWIANDFDLKAGISFRIPTQTHTSYLYSSSHKQFKNILSLLSYCNIVISLVLTTLSLGLNFSNLVFHLEDMRRNVSELTTLILAGYSRAHFKKTDRSRFFDFERFNHRFFVI